jgi:hypothetical protein
LNISKFLNFDLRRSNSIACTFLFCPRKLGHTTKCWIRDWTIYITKATAIHSVKESFLSASQWVRYILTVKEFQWMSIVCWQFLLEQIFARLACWCAWQSTHLITLCIIMKCSSSFIHNKKKSLIASPSKRLLFLCICIYSPESWI